MLRELPTDAQFRAKARYFWATSRECCYGPKVIDHLGLAQRRVCRGCGASEYVSAAAVEMHWQTN